MIKLTFSGDFAPVIEANAIQEDHFSSLGEILANSDLHITNLECPLTSSTTAAVKTGPSIRAVPGAVRLLLQAQTGIACLANNHIYDYGVEGIEETVGLCEDNKIDVAGIITGKLGRKPWAVREIKNMRIGILNYCESEFSVRGRNLTGATEYDPVDAFNDITLLKKESDYIVVVYHGGNEYYPLPRPDLKKDFHYLVDIGADAVVSHHTHMFSGYEFYKGKPVVYGLGNFFFPYEGEPETWHEGLLCQITIDKVVEVRLIPVIQCHGNLDTVLAGEDISSEMLSRVDRLSEIIRTDEKLVSEWGNFVQTVGEDLANKVLYPTFLDRVLFKIPLLNKLVVSRQRQLALTNMLRCKSMEQLITDNLISRE